MKNILFILIVINFLYGKSEFEDDFSDWLAKETEVATKTKVNIDFVPGMVSVLKQEELLKLGIDNIYEAMNLMPGIDFQNRFLQEPIVRGVGNSFSSGKIKVMINSTSFNNSYNALGLLPHIPIEIIDRIEFIRGAGSAIYGEYAYVGVVNIVLKEDKKNTLFYKFNRYSKDNESNKVGGYFHFLKDDLNLNLSFFKDNSDGLQLYAKNSFGVVEPELISSENGVNTILNYKNFSMKFINFEQKYGSGLGVNSATAKADGAMNNFINSYLFELNQKFEFNDLTIFLKAGEFKLKKSALSRHNAFVNGESKVGIFDTMWTLKDNYFNSEFKYSGFNNHKLLLGFDFKRVRQINEEGKINFTFTFPITYFDELLPFSMTSKNAKRDITSIYFQDEFKLSENIDIIAGGRFDKYSDVKNSINPRLAGVYEFNENTIFKLQYAKAFRPPTFAELYFTTAPKNHNIEAETIDSYELSHIYNKNNFNLKTTLFFLKLKNLIDSDLIRGYYINQNRVTSEGVEIEARYNYKDYLALSTNISYANPKDDLTNNELKAISKILGNLSLILKPHGKYQLGLLYNYLGDKDRLYSDGKVSDTHILSTTFSIKKIFNIFNFQIGIKNIFNNEVFYPATQTHIISDYPTDSRTYWFKLSSEF